MSQYQTGVVDVTSGSATVSGTGTTWTTNVTVGDLFMVTGYSVQYQVASIPTDTSLTLNTTWAGSSLTDQTYTITRDFTTNLSLPEIYPGDRNWAFNITVAFRIIDLAMSDVGTSAYTVEQHTTDTTLTTSDLQKIHVMNSTSSRIFWLPSIDSSDVGSWIIIRKANSGDVRIVAADSDTVMDDSARMIENTYSTESWSHIKLFVETSTKWGCHGMLGRWTTADVSPSQSPSPSVSPSPSPS